MSWARLAAVLRKETTDHMRDRRALLSASFGIFFGPIFLSFILGEIASDRRSAEDLTLPMAGREHAEPLANWLEQQAGVELTPAPADPKEAVRSGEASVVLVVEPEFSEDLAEARPAKVQLIFDGQESVSRTRARRIRELVEAYSGSIASLRLIARGVSPTAVRAVRVDDIDLADPRDRARELLGMVPLWVMIALFAAGMSAAADSTAGERERGSLEPLLANPVSPLEVAVGKWLAATLLAALGGALALIFNLFVLDRAPLYELGLRFRLAPEPFLAAAAVLLPVALFAPALEMLIATFARSFKEAQSYLAFAMMLPTVPVMIMIFSQPRDQLWLSLAPILGQSRAVTTIIGGDVPDLLPALGCAAITAAAAVACVVAVSRLLRREKIIFGR